MYIIVVYDVEEKRVAKVLKFLRGYLHWVQNSVFEGEVTEGKLKEIQIGLKKIIKGEEDSIIFYKLAAEQEVQKEIMGLEKSSTETML